MHKHFFKLVGFILFLILLLELLINYLASYALFPINYADSYGYIKKDTGKVVVPLNKYHSRFISCFALPYEIFKLKYYDKNLTKAYDKNTNKYGFKDAKGNVLIDYKFSEAWEFDKNYALVAINKGNDKKFGTINKQGKWMINPEYSYICNSKKYYLKACVDKNHCGVLDIFGNQITQMTYNIEHIKCENCDKIAKFCEIGSKNKNINCNYFLW